MYSSTTFFIFYNIIFHVARTRIRTADPRVLSFARFAYGRLTVTVHYWIFKILFKKLIVDTKQENKDHDQGQSVGQITAHPVVDF